MTRDLRIFAAHYGTSPCIIHYIITANKNNVSMKKILLSLTAILSSAVMTAQDISQF